MAARSRQIMRAAAATVGVFVLAVGILWVRRERGWDAPADPARPIAARVAPLRQDSGGTPAQPEPGAAFLEPSGAGAMAYRSGDHATALAQFEEAVRKNPTDTESLSNLAQVLVRLGRTAEALPHLERATALNPDRWAYRFNLARALGLLQRWEEAIASYQQAQRLFPDDYVTTFNLAMTLHKAGQETAAVEQYRRAIELNPEDPSFRIALANSYERLQKTTEAVSAYSEYLRLAPSGAEAEQVRARIAQLTGPAANPGSN
jgi:Flp pilus assembly protein TadD